MLRELGDLRTEYASDTDDIAKDFYNPCLSQATTYDRITGFFSSTVFYLTQRGLADFFGLNGGKMRILCSPRLSASDAESVLFGYAARSDAELSQALHDELGRMLASPRAHTTKLLAALVASGRLEIRLATVASSAAALDTRMFHDKVGLFGDRRGDLVGFRGSMNESYLGLSPDGNIESVDVWPSWEGGRDAERVANAVARFDHLWANEVEGVRVVSLPDDIRRELELVAHDSDLEALLRQLGTGEGSGRAAESPSIAGTVLREHQIEAVAEWAKHGHRGLLEHATGSGKTITGLFAAREALDDGLVPLVLVPSTLLHEQWVSAVRQLLGARVVAVGAGNRTWVDRASLRAAVEASRPDRPYAIVASIQSALSPAFRAQLRPVAHRLFVVADEVHRLGSPTFRTILDWLDAPWRLGLSATPERANDPEGSRQIFDYFGGVVHRYSLKNALDDDVLSPYFYSPSWVGLTDEEQTRWDALTAEIRRRYAIATAPGARPHTHEQLVQKLIERARIAKGAANKVPAAAEIVAKNFDPDGTQRWLVYCESTAQVDLVRAGLRSRGIASWEYHRQMAGDPEATLRLFESEGGVIVAIKCLDEGVDIPSASHALIIASSRNPREFIQRRGRVLRRAPRKTEARVFDVLVLPETVRQDDPTWPLVAGELARALEFARWALGRSAVSKLEDKWVEMGLSLADLDRVRPAGLESDSEGDEDRDE